MLRSGLKRDFQSSSSPWRKSVAKMAHEECQHPLHLVTVLGRATENVIVPASLVVHGFHRLTGRSQRRLKVARHLYVRERAPAVGGAVCRAMQHQDRCFDLRGKVSELTWIARGVENGGLHVTHS